MLKRNKSRRRRKHGQTNERIPRTLPRWHWNLVLHFILRVINDVIYDSVARNRYRWFGRRDACILTSPDRSRLS